MDKELGLLRIDMERKVVILNPTFVQRYGEKPQE